jgi:acetyl-CoA/propionyl-CoA carboxylase, biotin carboxylase, biotin carboxyl carrier protein
MIAKLIVHGVDREHARMRMLRALDEFEIGGLPTLLGFHRALLSHPEFVAGGTGHGLVESEELASRADELTREPAVETASSNGRLRPRATAVEVGGRRYDVTMLEPEPPWVELARRRRDREASGRGGAGSDSVISPMQGTVLKVDVAEGDEIEAGTVICVVEAMKMENEIAAHRAGTVADISVAPGDAVASGQVICRVVSDEA